MTEQEYKLTLPERLRRMNNSLSAVQAGIIPEQEKVTEACLLLAEAADEIERLRIKAMPQSGVYISNIDSLAAINTRRASQGLPPL